jgi:formylglycine-generating enzyme required for sulfatase activity
MTFKDNTTLQISTYQFDTVFIDGTGNLSRRDHYQASCFTEFLGNGVVLEMVRIPEGAGQIGSPIFEEGHSDDEEIHPAQFTEFFMGKYPITQAQWKAVALLPQVNCSLNPEPSCFKGLNRPVEQVSWYDAIEFCARLSRATERLYRLPTEAEWEYACRAKTTSPFHLGETLSTDWANYRGEDHFGKGRTKQGIRYRGSYGKGSTGIDRKETTEVGHFQAANAFGLYDMHGNISEWCSHHSYENSSDSLLNQQCLIEEAQQPLRGGSWRSSPSACRSAFRLQTSPSCREAFIGFRVVYFQSRDCFVSRTSSPSFSQDILSNIQVGGNLIVGNITQLSNQPMTPVDPPSDPISRRTILFLASSPTEQARLRQDKEVREVNSGLERAKYREQFKLEQRWAARSIDLRRALLDLEPQILHFSGHGGGEVGLVLEDQLGSTKLIATGTLAALFQQFAQRGLECIVLNACYSDVQATAIVQHIPYVIGMNHAISDIAAIEFSIGFYDALGAGWSYEEAFEMGKNTIALEGVREEMIPILRKKADR